jgi:hypothetical protein
MLTLSATDEHRPVLVSLVNEYGTAAQLSAAGAARGYVGVPLPPPAVTI